jgi:hypothetical protein
MYTYQANRLIRSDRERYVAHAGSQVPGHVSLLRPNRKHLFPRTTRLPAGSYVPDFFKPAFLVLAQESDPDKHPRLAVEVDEPSPEMRAMYQQHEVPYAVLQHEPTGATVLRMSLGATRLTVEEPNGKLAGALSAALAMAGRSVGFHTGSYVHSYHERVLREAVETLGPTFRVACHHQVPVAFVLGHQPDLSSEEKRLLGCDIDAVITQRLDVDPDATVLLAVKLDLHDSHGQPAVADRDSRIRALFDRLAAPLVVVTPAEKGCRFECNLTEGPVVVERPDPVLWADALTPMLTRALRHARRV